MVANAAKKVHDQLLKKLESDKKYADIKNLNLKGNRIVNLTHFGKELEQGWPTVNIVLKVAAQNWTKKLKGMDCTPSLYLGVMIVD